MSKGQVTVSINGVDYPMACAPGEEGKVIALGAKIDEVARQISAASGSIGEARILVMASLILTDRMSELEQRITQLENGEGADAAETPQTSPEFDEDRLVQIVDGLTTRLEKLASR